MFIYVPYKFHIKILYFKIIINHVQNLFRCIKCTLNSVINCNLFDLAWILDTLYVYELKKLPKKHFLCSRELKAIKLCKSATLKRPKLLQYSLTLAQGKKKI